MTTGETADDNWQDGAFISSWHHERSNKDTSNRIKRSHRNRFRNGAILTDLGVDGSEKVERPAESGGR